MKQLLVIFLLIIPFILVSQFVDKEIYTYGQLGINIGMRDYNYTTTLGGLASDQPVSAKLQLGSSLVPEIGLGFMVVKHFFVEVSLATSIIERNNRVNTDTKYYIEKYQFYKTIMGLNGVYFLDIDDGFNLEFKAGVSAVLPQNLMITTSEGVETIKYNSTVGFQTGFGGNYLKKNLAYGFGLAYRIENLAAPVSQNTPVNFYALNPNISRLELRSMIISLSVKYLF